MVEIGIRGKICHAIHWHKKAGIKYMKDYGENKEPSYHKYWDAHNLYGWTMVAKVVCNKDFIES